MIHQIAKASGMRVVARKSTEHKVMSLEEAIKTHINYLGGFLEEQEILAAVWTCEKSELKPDTLVQLANTSRANNVSGHIGKAIMISKPTDNFYVIGFPAYPTIFDLESLIAKTIKRVTHEEDAKEAITEFFDDIGVTIDE